MSKSLKHRHPLHAEISIADLITQSANNKSSHEKSISNLLEYYISGDIEEPSEYTEWFNEIRHARDGDVIKIYINSCGGDLFTAIQFMRVLRETKALVIVSVEGACMSAATMIFLAADKFEISAHSSFMFHNYSGGAIGKGGEMMDQLAFESKWAEAMLRDVYMDFLTAEEITSILANKDFWMDSDDVIARLNKRAEKIEEKAKAEEAKSAESSQVVGNQ